MDMSKAFDSLHHSLILAKLNAYGFSDSSLDLMRSFFYGRLNWVKVSTAKSDWKEMKREAAHRDHHSVLCCGNCVRTTYPIRSVTPI